MQIAGDNTSIYNRARSWIEDSSYWKREELHFAKLNGHIRDWYAVEHDTWYEKLGEIPECPPLDLLECQYKCFEDVSKAAHSKLGNVPLEITQSGY